MIKKSTVVLTALLVIVATVSFAGPGKERSTEIPDKIIIGSLEPLTGAHAVFGTEARLGTELAVRHINESGGIKSMGGVPLELVVEDCGENADTAKLGAESIISKHHPVAIVGLYISRLTVAASEVTEREKVILLVDALVDSVTGMGRQYLFRPGPKASQHGASAIEFSVEAAKNSNTPLKKVAILNEDSAFGRSNTIGAADAALNNGLTIVYQREYPYDIADVSSLVNDIAAARPDLVVHCPYFTDAILFANTFKEAAKIPKFIAGMGACGYTDPDSIDALGASADYYSNTYSYNPAKNTPQNKKFVQDFIAEKGHIPTEAGGMDYYTTWVFKEALELSGQMFPDDPLNPDNIRAAFLKLDLTSGPAVETFPGSRISFTGTGDNPHARAVILQVLDGQPKTVWPTDAAEAKAVYPRPDATY
jgi:branched-chain amino acid transport system substrate-binding protein